MQNAFDLFLHLLFKSRKQNYILRIEQLSIIYLPFTYKNCPRVRKIYPNIAIIKYKCSMHHRQYK